MVNIERNFAEQQALIQRKIDAVIGVVTNVTSIHQDLRHRFGGSYLSVITRDEEGGVFMAEVDTDHPDYPDYPGKISIRSYMNYGRGFRFGHRTDRIRTLEVIDYVQMNTDRPAILCDSAIIDELVKETQTLQVGENDFVLHRPYGLVRIYSSASPSEQGKAIDYDKYFGVEQNA